MSRPLVVTFQDGNIDPVRAALRTVIEIISATTTATVSKVHAAHA